MASIIVHSQVKAPSTDSLSRYAGKEAQFVWNKEDSHMYVMSGSAGINTKLANSGDSYPKSETYSKAEVDQIVSGGEVDLGGYLQKTEAESTYLKKTDAQSTYLGKSEKAQSATTSDQATKATQDGSGNVIVNTYATKIELSSKVDNSAIADMLTKTEAGSTYATKTELSNKADTSALSAYLQTSVAESTYAKKTDISAVWKMKGKVENESSLPSESNSVGDVWHVEDTQKEFVWTDSQKWEEIGVSVDLSGYATKSELTEYLPLTGGTISGALTVSGSITGTISEATHATNADNATKATQDASGNTITSTYATKTELNGYQVKGNYLTPDSTIDYSKIINIPLEIDYGTLEG